MILAKRLQQGVFSAIAAANRFGGANGAGSGLGGVMANGGFAADSTVQGYATASQTTYVDITNSSFTISVPRTTYFFYLVLAAAQISAGTGIGTIRGLIVGYDGTANMLWSGGSISNGFIWYGPQIKGPIQPGNYTVKMQAGTDNGTTIQVRQIFHQFLFLGA